MVLCSTAVRLRALASSGSGLLRRCRETLDLERSVRRCLCLSLTTAPLVFNSDAYPPSDARSVGVRRTRSRASFSTEAIRRAAVILAAKIEPRFAQRYLGNGSSSKPDITGRALFHRLRAMGKLTKTGSSSAPVILPRFHGLQAGGVPTNTPIRRRFTREFKVEAAPRLPRPLLFKGRALRLQSGNCSAGCSRSCWREDRPGTTAARIPMRRIADTLSRAAAQETFSRPGSPGLDRSRRPARSWGQP